MLLNCEKWKAQPARKFIEKRWYSLIVPYLFFETVGIFWKMLFFHQNLWDGIWNLLSIRCNVGADWFLVAMFLGSLMVLVAVKVSNRVWSIVSTVACFLLPMHLSGQQIKIVIGRGLLAYGFIMLGAAGRKILQSERTGSVPWVAGSLTATALIAVIGLKWGGNDLYSCKISNPVTLVLGGLCGAAFILGVSRLTSNKIAAAVGRHTLTIMGTHQLVIYAMTELLPQLRNNDWCGFVLFAVIFAAEIPAVYLIDRYLPFFVGRTTERR